jgi:inner membrane transporter RhtA
MRATPTDAAALRGARPTDRIPPSAFFLVSAAFHYLGPAFAVLLFESVAPLGVAWLRIATAAAVFAAWRRPWRLLRAAGPADIVLIASLGVTLAVMNCVFYEAIDRLPLGTVGAIEFLGPIGLAAAGMRTRRNLAALALAVAGVLVLTEVRIEGEPLGYVFAFANCAAFVLYVMLAHRSAADGGVAGIDRLGAAMLVAAAFAFPFGIREAGVALLDPLLFAAAVGVGLSSSVIPYVCDQLAMARLPRATFALMLSLLPATACVIGVLVLHQIPSLAEAAGVALVVVGVGLHRPAARHEAG